MAFAPKQTTSVSRTVEEKPRSFHSRRIASLMSWSQRSMGVPPVVFIGWYGLSGLEVNEPASPAGEWDQADFRGTGSALSPHELRPALRRGRTSRFGDRAPRARAPAPRRRG